MNILDLYKSILECGGLTTDDEGFVSIKFDKKGSPVLVNGKRLVLPTQKQLTSENWNDKIVFHPLSENILRGESEVITKLRSVFNIRLNYTFAAVAQNLLTIISSVGEHNKLTPEQGEILSAVMDADETTLVSFTKMMVNSIGECPEKAFINIFLKRGGTINGKKYSRVGIVTFPLYEELKKNQETYYGVKLRSKDRQALIQLYEYMLPGLDMEESYNFGTDSNIAPFLDALMGTVLGIGSKMNDILELFGKLIDSGDQLVFESEWVDAFENLTVMLPQIRQIPAQQGNEGKVKGTETPQVTQATTVPQANPQLVYHPPQPIPQNPYQLQPPPQQYPFQQPQQQFVQQPPQGLVITENGLDFNSLLRNKPQLAGAAIPYGVRQQPMMMQQQEPPPRWAAPQIPVYNPYQQQPQQFQQPQYQQPMQQYPGSLV